MNVTVRVTGVSSQVTVSKTMTIHAADATRYGRRKAAQSSLVRVERGGVRAIAASKGGTPQRPP